MIVDRLVREKNADLRQACFFFGERLVYLRRAGVPVAGIPYDRWAEFFEAAGKNHVLWEGWDPIVRAMAAAPATPLMTILADGGYGTVPHGWLDQLSSVLGRAESAAYTKEPDRIFRVAMCLAMAMLRGKVPAVEVASVLKIASGGAR